MSDIYIVFDSTGSSPEIQYKKPENNAFKSYIRLVPIFSRVGTNSSDFGEDEHPIGYG